MPDDDFRITDSGSLLTMHAQGERIRLGHVAAMQTALARSRPANRRESADIFVV